MRSRMAVIYAATLAFLAFPAFGEASSLKIVSSASGKAGLRVLELAVPKNTRAIRVAWGDGTATLVTRLCARHPSGATATMYAPHVYTAARSFRPSVTLALRGCSARPAQAASALSQWASLDQTETLGHPSFATTAGTALAGGGCTIPLSVSQPAGAGTAVDTREDAIDPATCSILVETGSLPNATPPPLLQKLFAQTPTASAPANPLVPNYTVSEEHVGSIAHWNDRAGGWMNQIGDTLDWRYNGGCTTETYAWNSAYSLGVNWYYQSFNKYEQRNCNNAQVNANGNFADDRSPCTTGTVYNLYNSQFLWGYYNGGANGNTTGYVVGGNCVAAESLHDTLYGPYAGRQ